MRFRCSFVLRGVEGGPGDRVTSIRRTAPADPERFVAQMIAMGGKGLEGFQALMGAALSGAAPGKKK